MKKQGFTLAELLLCVGIIGIVGAMGMMATKHSVEQAYRGYWYTGYVALADSIADFEDNGRFDSQKTNEQITNGEEFAKRLHDIIGGTINNTTVTASNNIRYLIENITTDGTYYITMTVPQAKTRQNQRGTATTRFAYSHNNKVLIPIAGGTVNLQNRPDLLPFYKEEGNSGQTDRNYTGFIQAYCTSGVGETIYTNEYVQKSQEEAKISYDINSEMFEYKRIMALDYSTAIDKNFGSAGKQNGTVSPKDSGGPEKSMDIDDLKDRSGSGNNGNDNSQNNDNSTSDDSTGGTTGGTIGGNPGHKGNELPAPKVVLLDCDSYIQGQGQGVVKVANPRKIK